MRSTVDLRYSSSGEEHLTAKDLETFLETEQKATIRYRYRHSQLLFL